jgi:beta-glucosidase
MDLPGAGPKLISAVIAANPNTVVITQSGSPINMLPWSDKATTQVHTWYGGNETGNGIADVLFGDVNPSAKLPTSFPRRVEDNPTYLCFGSERGNVIYGESIYVGYRFYEKVGKEVLFPFGCVAKDNFSIITMLIAFSHGLSYTTFEFSDLQVSSTGVILKVANIGKVSGAEVVQVYVAADPKTSSIARPKKELKGFTKVFLEPGQSVEVSIALDRFATTFWDQVLNKWVNEKGEYRVLVGKSSAEIELRGSFKQGETTTWTGL